MCSSHALLYGLIYVVYHCDKWYTTYINVWFSLKLVILTTVNKTIIYDYILLVYMTGIYD